MKPIRSKAQIEAARQKIAELVGKNEQLLKEKGLTLEDVLKTLPKIRAQVNKERYPELYGKTTDLHGSIEVIGDLEEV